MKRTICTVKVVNWDHPYLITRHTVVCNTCDRLVGTFSKHESAMNWAQAHATSSKHIREEGE